jgi:hypothetical protein
MKVLLAITALGLCTLSPGISACDYDDATSASATPPAQLGLAPAPAASKAPVVKASAQKAATKQQVTKSKQTNDKIAAASPR